MNYRKDTGDPRQDEFSWQKGLKQYAVLVWGSSTRTRTYTTLDGAQRAVARARQRGDFAQMCLVRLVPVPGRRPS